MKGQTTIVNLLMLLMTFIAYFAMLPMLMQIISDTVIQLQANPTTMTSAIIMLLNLIPFLIPCMIIITGFIYAIPNREGVRNY